MARAGESIENRFTGERIVFRQTAAETGGEALVLEAYLERHGRGLPLHLHPRQEERIQVLRGSLLLVLDGREVVAGAGERVTVPAGVPHAYCNAGSGVAHLVAEIRPALRLESFLESAYRSCSADAYAETVRLVDVSSPESGPAEWPA